MTSNLNPTVKKGREMRMTETSVTSYQNHSHDGFTIDKAPVRIKAQPPCQVAYV